MASAQKQEVSERNTMIENPEKESTSKICPKLLACITRADLKPNISNAKLFAQSIALSELGVQILVETTTIDPFTAMREYGLINQEVVDQITASFGQGKRLEFKNRTRQLLYGLSTDEMMKGISDDDILKILCGM